MPCNCDHLKATQLEVETSKVACLLGELRGVKINKHSWEGYHPDVYGNVDKKLADKLTKELCSILQKEDVSKYSLEMQIWWRDHQEADRKRIEKEFKEKKDKKAKNKALSKLSEYEKRLLGL